LVEDGSLNEFDGDLHDYSLRILKNLNKAQPGKSKKKDSPTEGANKKS
jgi:hypothetical protein